MRWFGDYLKECKQRVTLNGQYSDWGELHAGVHNRINTVARLNDDLLSLGRWANRWLITFAPEKTKSLTISTKRDAHLYVPVTFKGHLVAGLDTHTYLGLLFTSNLSWNMHIHGVELKARTRLNLLLPVRFNAVT